MRLPSNHWIFEPRWITWGQELTVKVAMAKTAVSVSADGGPEKVHPVPDKVKKRRKSCPPAVQEDTAGDITDTKEERKKKRRRSDGDRKGNQDDPPSSEIAGGGRKKRKGTYSTATSAAPAPGEGEEGRKSGSPDQLVRQPSPCNTDSADEEEIHPVWVSTRPTRRWKGAHGVQADDDEGEGWSGGGRCGYRARLIP